MPSTALAGQAQCWLGPGAGPICHGNRPRAAGGGELCVRRFGGRRRPDCGSLDLLGVLPTG
eukprot:78709-Lingulodinium_polyedra.AAC.1